jgi:hypothetical protein
VKNTYDKQDVPGSDVEIASVGTEGNVTGSDSGAVFEWERKVSAQNPRIVSE